MAVYAIRAEQLSKLYQINRGKRRVMLRQALQDAIASGWDSVRAAYRTDRHEKQPSVDRTFWALHDVSFEIAAGEPVGIIGSNGAGKSTLLKILARVTTPTSGRVRLRGRVGSLLEVGTGFHSELTGRENVYLNGAVLGMRKREIDHKFDEIVEFSEVEDFLDTPVKFYSSGMRMRLAFSVAAHLEPEILLVDEVLAVGDVAFQRKSLDKMEDVVGHGRTILFVSHNLAAVRALCRSAIYLEQGQIVYAGEVNAAIENYLNQGQVQERARIEFEPDDSLSTQILSVSLEDENGHPVTDIPHDQPFWARLKIAVRSPVYKSHLTLHVLDSDLNTILTIRDIDEGGTSLISQSAGVYTYRVRFPAPCLVPGKYWLSLEATQYMGWRHRVLDRAHAVWPFEIYDNGSLLSRQNLQWSGKFILRTEWQCVEKEALGRG